MQFHRVIFSTAFINEASPTKHWFHLAPRSHKIPVLICGHVWRLVTVQLMGSFDLNVDLHIFRSIFVVVVIVGRSVRSKGGRSLEQFRLPH